MEFFPEPPPKVTGPSAREMRNDLLELYGMACAFKMLKPNGPGLPEEVKAAQKAAQETGTIMADKIKKLIMELP